MKQPITVLTFLLFGIYACNNSVEQVQSEKQNSDTIIDNTSSEIQKNIDTTDSNHQTSPEIKIENLKILRTGDFHDDEVWDNADHETWFGLFKSEQGFYLKKTKVNTQRVNDPIVDSENEKTGWEISTNNKDVCLILISHKEPLTFLTDRNVKNVAFSKNHIYPGDTLTFKYLGIEYKIFATGKKKKISPESEQFDVQDYKLYIKAIIEGQNRTSLLVAQPNFDDNMISVLFGGDIDGDGILDLIIDTSRHYNKTSPTLYLSLPAENGEVVKLMGSHSSVGC